MSLMLHRAGLIRPSAGDTGPFVPEAFEAGDWSIARGNTLASVTISELPENGGATITDIEYRLDGGSWVGSGGTVNFSITSLTNGQAYDVELRAVNSVGTGAASDTKQVTPATVPAVFEIGDWEIVSGDEEADVTIDDLPANGGDAITDIEYRLDGGSWTSSSGVTDFTISSLTNETEYDVELRAVNSVGTGAASDTKQVTPEGDGPAYDADAQAIFDEMDSTPDDTRKGHINTLIVALKTAGIWARLDIFYVGAAHDAQAARLNWKAPVGSFNLTAVNSPGFTTDRGYIGGSGAYLDTSWAPATHGVNYKQNDASIWVWMHTATAQSNNVFGISDGNRAYISPIHGTSDFRVAVNHAGAPIFGTNTDAGFFGGSRASSTIQKAWKNGSQFGSDGSHSSGTMSSLPMWVCGGNSAHTTAARISICATGDALTGLESAFHTAVAAYMTAVGA